MGARLAAAAGAAVVLAALVGCGNDAGVDSATTTPVAPGDVTSAAASATTIGATPSTTHSSTTAAPSTPSGEEQTATVTAWSEPVALVDEGVEPRRELRYGSVVAAAPATFALVDEAEGDRPFTLPDVITLDVELIGPGEGTSATVRTGLTTTTHDGQVTVHELESGRAQQLDVSPTGTITLTGPLTGLVNDIVMRSVAARSGLVIPPLPTDPVGVGARWTASVPDEPAWPLLAGEWNFELVDRSENTLRVAVTWTASGEEHFRGGLVDRMTETGEGALTIDLATTRPLSAAFTTTGTITPIVVYPEEATAPGSPDAAVRTWQTTIRLESD